MMDRKRDIIEALRLVQAPTDYNEWFGWLPRFKAVGITPEEAQKWSRKGGVKGKWIDEIPGKWAGLPKDDPAKATAVILSKARGIGGQGVPVRVGRGTPVPLDFARITHKQSACHGKNREGAYTIADLLNEPIWFVQSEKMPYQHRVDGGWAGYRHSLQEERGGVKTARYGGETTWTDPNEKSWRFLVYPHRTYHQIVDLIPALPNPRGLKLRPSISLAGDARYPHLTDLVVVDFDYKPSLDADGAGARFRDRARSAMAAYRAPVYGSSSGNGFHGLCRMDPTWIYSNRRQGTETRLPKNRKENISGGVAEIFPAGFRKHVVLRLENAVANHHPDLEIPIISEGGLWKMLVDAAEHTGTDF